MTSLIIKIMGNDKNGADYFKYQKQWFDFIEVTEENVTAMHTSLYTWIVQLNNRLQWCDVVGLPTDRTMRMCRIKSYKWYKKTLDDLIDWGFIKLIRKSRNQYTCNEVALVLNTKAVSKQIPKQLHHNKTIQTEETIKTLKETVENPSPSNLDFIQLIIEEFKKVFTEYVITTPGKEKASAGKLLSTFKDLHPELSSEEMLKELRSYFEACKNIGNTWYRANMSLSLMVSKYNEINNILNNPTQQRAGASPDLGHVDTTNYRNEGQ